MSSNLLSRAGRLWGQTKLLGLEYLQGRRWHDLCGTWYYDCLHSWRKMFSIICCFPIAFSPWTTVKSLVLPCLWRSSETMYTGNYRKFRGRSKLIVLQAHLLFQDNTNRKTSAEQWMYAVFDGSCMGGRLRYLWLPTHSHWLWSDHVKGIEQNIMNTAAK